MDNDLGIVTAVIDAVLGPSITETLLDGLPDGANPEWGYDEKLIKDIGIACHQWAERIRDAAKRK